MKLTQALWAPAGLALLGYFPSSTAVQLTPAGSKYSDELQAAAADTEASFAQTAVALGGKKPSGPLQRRNAVKRKDKGTAGAGAGGEQEETGGGGGETEPAAPTGEGGGAGGGSPGRPIQPIPSKAAAVLGVGPEHQKPRVHKGGAGGGAGGAEGAAGGAAEGKSFLQFRKLRGWLGKKGQRGRSGSRGSYDDEEGGFGGRINERDLDKIPNKARKRLGLPYEEEQGREQGDMGQMD